MAIAQAILKGRKPKLHAYVGLGPDRYKKRHAEPAMAEIDAMPREWRLLVHEYGGKIIHAYREHGNIKRVHKELFNELVAELDLDL